MKPGGKATTFNIDHIVVGPAGVFAIETKCWSKPKGDHVPKGESGNLTYEGEVLTKPNGDWDRDATSQTYRTSKHLSEWLGEALLGETRVQPVLVFPGWFVDRKKLRPFQILGGGELLTTIRETDQCILSAVRLAAIAKRVEDLCRNLDEQ